MSKATIYLNDSIHQALRVKSAETRQSMSDLVNDALKTVLAEDLEDIQDWKKRRTDKRVSYDDFLAQLKEDGTI
jgi:plasmid stability protein